MCWRPWRSSAEMGRKALGKSKAAKGRQLATFGDLRRPSNSRAKFFGGLRREHRATWHGRGRLNVPPRGPRATEGLRPPVAVVYTFSTPPRFSLPPACYATMTRFLLSFAALCALAPPAFTQDRVDFAR